jgi:putative transposase
VIETVMREELDQFIGAAWGESSPKRKGYRNGTYTRDLVTSTGRLQEIQVPRDRAGQFHTQAFERYRSSEPHIAEGLTQMFVAGTSTRHPWGKSLTPCWESRPVPARSVASTRASPTNLKRGDNALCKRDFSVLYLDGVHFSIRHGEKADATIILTALGVDLEGNKEVLARRSCAEESKEGWLSLLQDLRTRGATQMDLIVTDGHDGLVAAVSELFSAAPRKLCLLHKQRNVLSAIPRRERDAVQAELVGIWEQANRKEAVTQLTAFQAK